MRVYKAMSGMASYILVLLVFSLPAFAGQHAQKCKQAGDSSKAQCEGAAKAAGGADAAQAGKNIAGAGANPNVNIGSGAQGSQIADQTGRLTQAKSACEAAKKDCESKCDAAEAAAKADPNQQVRTSEPPQVKSEKEKSCVAPLAMLIGQIDSGLGNLAGDAKGTGDTKGSSGGMPMPIPIPPKDDKKEEPKPAADNLGTPLNCAQDGTQKYSDCNDYYINKCSGNMSQPGCDPFINRYCGPGTATNTTPPPADDALGTPNTTIPISNFSVATANLVADKQSEGMGTSFCQKANSAKFCQGAGREQCPSCKNLSNWSATPIQTAEQLKAAQNACPSDPMFLDPAVAAKAAGTTDATVPTSGISTMSTSTDKMGAVSGGIGAAGGVNAVGGAGSNAGTNGEVSESGISEGSFRGVNMDAAGSGGGGSSTGGDEVSNSGEIGVQSAGGARARLPAGNLISGARDVANQYGPSIFSISTTTYKALCTRGRLLHCRER